MRSAATRPRARPTPQPRSLSRRTWRGLGATDPYRPGPPPPPESEIMTDVATPGAPPEPSTVPARAELSINTIRTLAMDAVQAANSGHPGTAIALAPVAYTLWQ